MAHPAPDRKLVPTYCKLEIKGYKKRSKSAWLWSVLPIGEFWNSLFSPYLLPEEGKQKE